MSRTKTAARPPAPAPANVAIDGARVRELRQLAGFNMRELGERAVISTPYVSMIERGVRERVSPPVLARIGKALRVKPAALIKAPVAAAA